MSINPVISGLICSSVSMVIMALEIGHKDFLLHGKKLENMVSVQGTGYILQYFSVVSLNQYWNPGHRNHHVLERRPLEKTQEIAGSYTGNPKSSMISSSFQYTMNF